MEERWTFAHPTAFLWRHGTGGRLYFCAGEGSLRRDSARPGRGSDRRSSRSAAGLLSSLPTLAEERLMRGEDGRKDGEMDGEMAVKRDSNQRRGGEKGHDNGAFK